MLPATPGLLFNGRNVFPFVMRDIFLRAGNRIRLVIRTYSCRIVAIIIRTIITSWCIGVIDVFYGNILRRVIVLHILAGGDGAGYGKRNGGAIQNEFDPFHTRVFNG